MSDKDSKLKPVNHHRTPSFELVLKKMRSDGKDPNDFVITRMGDKNYRIMKKKKQPKPVQVEYVEEAVSTKTSRAHSAFNSSSDESSEENIGKRMHHKRHRRPQKVPRPERHGNGRKASQSMTDALNSKRIHRERLASKNIKKRDDSSDRRRPRRSTKRRPRTKSILKKREAKTEWSMDADDEEHSLDSDKSEEYVTEMPEMLPSRRGRSQNRQNTKKKQYQSRGSSRGPRLRSTHTDEEGSGIHTAENKKTTRQKKAQDKLEKDKKKITEDVERISKSLKEINPPDKRGAEIDRHSITNVHGPAIGNWKGMGEIYKFIESVYPGEDKKQDDIDSSSDDSEGTSSAPVKMGYKRNSSDNADDIKENVKELLEEKRLPQLVDLKILEERDAKEQKRRQTNLSASISKTEKIKKAAPQYASGNKRRGTQDVIPYAHTTMYESLTRYGSLVETCLLIPQHSKRYKAKIKSALEGVDMMVEEYKQDYKHLDATGELVTQPSPNCIRKVVCFPNLARNHAIEPVSGFGIVMNATKTVPLKTTPFNPTKFFYGTLAFRIPTDDRVDPANAISKFKIHYQGEDVGSSVEVSLLNYTEETSPIYLAESLIPSEAKEFRNEKEDADFEDCIEYELSETPNMDRYLDGRGSYAGLYRSSTRDDDWRKHLWVVVQCNDPYMSQELYDHLMQVQDESMGIKDEDRGFSHSVTQEDDSNDDEEEEEEKEKDNEKSEKTGVRIRANWASAIFSNHKVRDVRLKMSEARLKTAQELLSAYGVNVTTDEIKKHCHPFIETVTNTFYHDVTSLSYIFAGSGVTIVTPDTKYVVVGEKPSKGPIILQGPPKSLETRTSARDNTLSWDLSESKELYRMFPCSTGRQRTNENIKQYLSQSSSASTKVPILRNVVYKGKIEKERDHYDMEIDDGGTGSKKTQYIDPSSGNYHVRLTDITYNKRTISHLRREEKCGFNRDWGMVELEPLAVRVGKEKEKATLFSF